MKHGARMITDEELENQLRESWEDGFAEGYEAGRREALDTWSLGGDDGD